MNKLNKKRRAQVVAALVEGNSINATVRMTGVAKHTVLKLLADLGKACSAYQDRVFRNLPCKRIQCDEIWSFCYAKEKNVPEELKGQFGVGDVWTWTALCADTKLVPCWMIGERNADDALKFMNDLASRLAHRVQLTTDGVPIVCLQCIALSELAELLESTKCRIQRLVDCQTNPFPSI